MPKVFTSEKQKIGEIGESVACKFLVKHGFTILERNYTKKWGEIDIVAQRQENRGLKLYFVEVKAVTRDLVNVSRITIDQYKPEDNMHPWKLKRLSRTIQTYLVSKHVSESTEWQFDLLVVFLDMNNKKARVKRVEDVIL
ncbi:MAG: YraN family protein [Patescibacteria group bacterium]